MKNYYDLPRYDLPRYDLPRYVLYKNKIDKTDLFLLSIFILSLNNYTSIYGFHSILYHAMSDIRKYVIERVFNINLNFIKYEWFDMIYWSWSQSLKSACSIKFADQSQSSRIRQISINCICMSFNKYGDKINL